VSAGATGIALALLFAFATVRLGADQIIVGAALNLLALGVTGALYRAVLGATGTALVLPTLPALELPLLRQIPVLGTALFGQHALVYLGLCLTPVLAFVLTHTGLGLRVRALGDHPLAAASLGLPVRSYRTLALAAGGMLAGLGGAALTLAATNTFVEGITAGRGFIALAVVVFGRWSPWGVLGGALLFGLASALQFQFQAAALAIPYQVFLMLPYVLTLGVLLVSTGAVRAPRALGARYDRE
jgi:simple sugar transport system permease protein